MEGKGILIERDGEKHKGWWKNGEPYGYCIKIDYDHDIYEGNFEGYDENGYGV